MYVGDILESYHPEYVEFHGRLRCGIRTSQRGDSTKQTGNIIYKMGIYAIVTSGAIQHGWEAPELNGSVQYEHPRI